MKIFNNYLGDFEDIFSRKVKVDENLIKSQQIYANSLQKREFNKAIIHEDNLPTKIEGPKILFKYDQNQLEQFFGKNPSAFDIITIGAHPDFKDISPNTNLFHHCTSVFIDIKGSTKLINKYTLPEIRLIKDSILTLAILVANQFGGHIHRLQGDGIFIQFVRRGRHPNESIINALNMTAILTNFVSTELSLIMEKNGIAPIKIRVGIDYGTDEKVLWSYYGLPGCNELTTTSLHTDMAAKLQAIAKNNSILIGDNVLKTLDLRNDYIEFYKNGDNEERVYKITTGLTYPFYVFNWKKYLTLFPFFTNNSQKPELITNYEGFSLICKTYNVNSTNELIYFPNSYPIKKDEKIKFTLLFNGLPYSKLWEDRILWKASNSGKEAAELDQSEHNFGGSNDDSITCESTAAYLGHHILSCVLKRQNKADINLSFPIFVQ
jgi:adenylate cyclase